MSSTIIITSYKEGEKISYIEQAGHLRSDKRTTYNIDLSKFTKTDQAKIKEACGIIAENAKSIFADKKIKPVSDEKKIETAVAKKVKPVVTEKVKAVPAAKKKKK